MTRWYPVPVPLLGNKVIFKIYNSEGHFVADACDEATAAHIADLHNMDLRVTEITDEDYGDEPVAAVNLSDHDSAFTLGRVYKITSTDHRGYNSRDDDDDPRWRGWSDSDWQPLCPGKVYAQAPLSVDRYYLTPGKCYEVIEDDGEAFSFYTDEGYFYGCTMWEGAAPLDFKNWTRIIPENL